MTAETGEIDRVNEGQVPESVGEKLEGLWDATVRYPGITYLWQNLHLPVTSAMIASESKRLGVSRGAVRARLVASVFGEKGTDWLETRGKSGLLEERGVPEEMTLTATKEALDTVENNFDTGQLLPLLSVGSEIGLLTEGPSQVVEEFYGDNGSAEDRQLANSILRIVNQVNSPLARGMKDSQHSRVAITDRLGSLTRKFPGMMSDKGDRGPFSNWLADQLITSSMYELSPDVLLSMVGAFRDIVFSWGDETTERASKARSSQDNDLAAAIRAEKMRGVRVDVGAKKLAEEASISEENCLAASRALVAIYFRAIPEVVFQSGKVIEEIKDRIPFWEKVLKSASQREIVAEIRDIVSLRGLSRDYAKPLVKFLDVDKADVLINLGQDSSQREVGVKLTGGYCGQLSVEKAFAWCALHFPEMESIVVTVSDFPRAEVMNRSALVLRRDVGGKKTFTANVAEAYRRYLLKRS